MLVVLGDLVEDVVVRLDRQIRPATDTPARVHRRRGGSAANVAVAAARLGRQVRFLGQVGDDPVGRHLVAELDAEGVDVSQVVTMGRTGTIVVLVDRDGERTMLTDRGACTELAPHDVSWLDGAEALHVPLYSLTAPPLADTAVALVAAAHDRGVSVSIDLSSVALIDDLGRDTVGGIVARLAPDVVLANVDEARALPELHRTARTVVVEHGPTAARLHVTDRHPVSVPALRVDRAVDTTGAGDAFAAGFLTWRAADDPATTWRDDPIAACRVGHGTAAGLLAGRGAVVLDEPPVPRDDRGELEEDRKS